MGKYVVADRRERAQNDVVTAHLRSEMAQMRDLGNDSFAHKNSRFIDAGRSYPLKVFIAKKKPGMRSPPLSEILWTNWNFTQPEMSLFSSTTWRKVSEITCVHNERSLSLFPSDPLIEGNAETFE
jgi:hypothetical protein